MSRRKKFLHTIQHLIPEYSIEQITTKNYMKFLEVFYTNEEYYNLTEGRNATESDCIETIDYCPMDFNRKNVFCIGFSVRNVAVGVVSYLEGYPEKNILWIGLLLINETFKRKGIGSEIINAMILAAKITSFDTIRLSVQGNNISGVKFWGNQGFVVINSVPVCANDITFNILTMEKCFKS